MTGMGRSALLGALVALTACTGPAQTPAPAPAGGSEVAVVDSRLIEGTDLCGLAEPEELEWLLGERLTERPTADPADLSSCAARFTGTTLHVAGRPSAAGVRSMVAGNTAFTHLEDAGCRVSVALLPGSTPKAGSYLSVAVTHAGAAAPLDCRTAGRVAEYLLRQLPRQ